MPQRVKKEKRKKSYTTTKGCDTSVGGGIINDGTGSGTQATVTFFLVFVDGFRFRLVHLAAITGKSLMIGIMGSFSVLVSSEFAAGSDGTTDNNGAMDCDSFAVEDGTVDCGACMATATDWFLAIGTQGVHLSTECLEDTENVIRQILFKILVTVRGINHNLHTTVLQHELQQVIGESTQTVGAGNGGSRKKPAKSWLWMDDMDPTDLVSHLVCMPISLFTGRETMDDVRSDRQRANPYNPVRATGKRPLQQCLETLSLEVDSSGHITEHQQRIPHPLFIFLKRMESPPVALGYLACRTEIWCSRSSWCWDVDTRA